VAEDETHYTISDAPEPPEPEDAAPAAEPGGGTTVEVVEEPFAADEPTGPGPKDAWREVLAQIDALGDSMTRWAKAAVNDPENRRHADEIKARLDSVGSKVASTFDEATKTDIGKSVQQAAETTGKAVVEAGGKVAAEAAPVVASALSGFAGMLGKAAERVSTAADKRTSAPEPAPTETDPEPETDSAPAAGSEDDVQADA